MSVTVTVALQVALLPLASVTVTTTAFVPMFEQSNAVGFTVISMVEQLSAEPVPTITPSTVTFPVASKFTNTSWQLAVGLVGSDTVMVASQVAVFPATSVAVSVTVTDGTSAHVNAV